MSVQQTLRVLELQYIPSSIVVGSSIGYATIVWCLSTCFTHIRDKLDGDNYEVFDWFFKKYVVKG